jgi:hypothetical protein
MKRRWRLWLGLAVVLVLAGGLAHPSVHWRLIGWLKGEAFYQGRPTSWWAGDIDAHYIPMLETWVSLKDSFTPAERQAEIDRNTWIVGWRRDTPEPWWERRPDWWNDWWYPGQARARVVMILDDRPPLVDGDPDALPVLLALLRRPEPKARQVAVSGLASLKSRDPTVIDALSEAMWDLDPAIRHQAEQAIREIVAEPVPQPDGEKAP